MLPKVTVGTRGQTGLLLELTPHGGIFLFPSELPLQQILPLKINTAEEETELNAELIGKLKTDTLTVFDEVSSKMQHLILARFNTTNRLKNLSQSQEAQPPDDLYHVICSGTQGDPFSIYAEDISPIGLQAYTSSKLPKGEPFQLLFLLSPNLPYVEATGTQVENIQLSKTVIIPGSKESCGYRSTVVFLTLPHDHLERLVLHSVETGRISIPSLSEIAILSKEEPINSSNDEVTLEQFKRIERANDVGTQKRQYMRASLKLKVFYNDQDGRLRNGYTRDISAGGVGLVSENSFPIGAEIPITIVAPEGLPPISARGKVAWSFCKGLQCFTGLAFTDIAGENKAILARLVFSSIKK